MYPIIERMFKDETYSSVFEVGSAVGGLFQGLQGTFGGIDVHKEDNKTIKQIYPEFADNFILRDAWDVPWPIPDNAYDIVFTVGFFTVIDRDPMPVIKEMQRIGKKVIMAENHGEESKNVSDSYVRVIRDYKKLLPNAKFEKFSDDKTIIWLTKQDKF